ncbi:MAG: hypothetical protein WC972_12790 [Trueperaceae bacterium]
MAYPVAGSYITSPAYSGTFIPEIWAAKLNAKFYKTTVFGEIANTDWQGDISGLGDKVIINNIPDIAISDYTVGSSLTYEVPTPGTVELLIDKGKSFAFQVNDVLAMQSKIGLMDTFTNNATTRMKIYVDADVLFGTYNQGSSANLGATAGVRSASYNLGTDTTPFALNGTTDAPLDLILAMAAVLDEQDVPDDGRYIIIDPQTRNELMSTRLAQANMMGDSASMVRNGLIGKIDRFMVYLSNNLPRGDADKAWVDGLTSPATGAAAAGKKARRAILAGHKSAISFASQMTKMETLRIQNDFGDYVRGLNVYGYKVVKPESLALAVVS